MTLVFLAPLAWGDIDLYDLSGSADVTDPGTITLHNTVNAYFEGNFTGSPTKLVIDAGDYTQGLTGTGIPNDTAVEVQTGTLDFDSNVDGSYGLNFTVASGAAIQYKLSSTGDETSNITIEAGSKVEFSTVINQKPFTGSLSGAGDIYVKGTAAQLAIDFQSDNSTYSGNFYIWGEAVEGGKDKLAVVRAKGVGEKSYFGTGTIYLEKGVISNTNYGSPTITNNIVVTDYGILRAGNNKKTLTFNGNITGSGKIYIARDNGTVILGGENTYSGGTEIGTSPADYSGIYGSTIKIAHPNALGTGPVNFNYEYATLPTTLDIDGYNVTIGGLSSLAYGTTDTYLSNVYFYDSKGDGVVTISSTVAAGKEAIYAGKFTDPDGLYPIQHIQISGAGTQTFANTIPEATVITIDGGTVKLTSIQDRGIVGNLNSKVVVKNGGTLLTDYSLEYDSNNKDYIDIAGGNFSDGGTLQVDIASLTSFSRFDLTGEITETDYTPGIGFVRPNLIEDFVPTVGDTFALSYNVSQYQTSVEDVDLEYWLGAGDRAAWNLHWYVSHPLYGSPTLVLEFQGYPIPEPSTWVLLLSGIVVILHFRRKRRNYAMLNQ